MSFNVYTADFFDRELKKLAKKYPSVKNDFKALVDSLKKDPKRGQLVGEGELRVLDKRTLKRLEDIELLPDEDRNHIFYTLDNLIKAAKLKAI
jgi:hypothetical protein